MNPPNNIRNGFFTPVSPFFSKIRKLTVFSRNPHTPIIPQSVRLRMDADGSFVPRNRLSCHVPAARPVRPAHSNSSETKKIICSIHAAHDGHMIGLTPSTACGRSPSLKEGGLGLRRSRPPALPSIGYRGFAVAPKTLRASSRSPLYNPGCRVETLLVSKGVMGFLGDLREDRSRARPVGGSARRSIPSEREQPCCDL